MVAAFAGVKKGEDLTEKFGRLKDYFKYSEKYNVGLKLKEAPNTDKYTPMYDRMYGATEDLYMGKSGTKEKPIVKIDYDERESERYIFNGDKAELEKRLRRAAKEIATGDTFMYFTQRSSRRLRTGAAGSRRSA